MTYQIQFFNSFHCNTYIPLVQRSKEDTMRIPNMRTIDQTFRETSWDNWKNIWFGMWIEM